MIDVENWASPLTISRGVVTLRAIGRSTDLITVSTDTRDRILESARHRLIADGFSELSSRKVADDAGVPLSQIHYHFGSMEELVLSLLRAENDRLIARQTDMYERDIPLSERWRRACEFLDVDIDSGYVRVIHEMTAAGWSTEPVRKEVRLLWGAWMEVLLGVVRDAEQSGMEFSPFSAGELVALVSAAFVGGESLLLLGFDEEQFPFRRALDRVGSMIEILEGSGP